MSSPTNSKTREKSERRLQLVEVMEAITEHGLSVPQSRRGDMSAPP